MNHETIEIKVNNQQIFVDKEMANVIPILNKLGYKTSGCCIGDDGEKESWIIIQEIDEKKIIDLIRKLDKCAYQLTKVFYKKNSDETIYVHYVLKTPEGSLNQRISWINEWVTKLEWCYLTNSSYKEFNIKTNRITYDTIDKLFL